MTGERERMAVMRLHEHKYEPLKVSVDLVSSANVVLLSDLDQLR